MYTNIYDPICRNCTQLIPFLTSSMSVARLMDSNLLPAPTGTLLPSHNHIGLLIVGVVIDGFVVLLLLSSSGVLPSAH